MRVNGEHRVFRKHRRFRVEGSQATNADLSRLIVGPGQARGLTAVDSRSAIDAQGNLPFCHGQVKGARERHVVVTREKARMFHSVDGERTGRLLDRHGVDTRAGLRVDGSRRERTRKAAVPVGSVRRIGLPTVVAEHKARRQAIETAIGRRRHRLGRIGTVGIAGHDQTRLVHRHRHVCYRVIIAWVLRAIRQRYFDRRRSRMVDRHRAIVRYRHRRHDLRTVGFGKAGVRIGRHLIGPDIIGGRVVGAHIERKGFRLPERQIVSRLAGDRARGHIDQAGEGPFRIGVVGAGIPSRHRIGAGVDSFGCHLHRRPAVLAHRGRTQLLVLAVGRVIEGHRTADMTGNEAADLGRDRPSRDIAIAVGHLLRHDRGGRGRRQDVEFLGSRPGSVPPIVQAHFDRHTVVAGIDGLVDVDPVAAGVLPLQRHGLFPIGIGSHRSSRVINGNRLAVVGLGQIGDGDGRGIHNRPARCARRAPVIFVGSSHRGDQHIAGPRAVQARTDRRICPWGAVLRREDVRRKSLTEIVAPGGARPMVIGILKIGCVRIFPVEPAPRRHLDGTVHLELAVII